MTDTVLSKQRGAVQRLTLNRPTKLNAMNADLVHTLVASIEAAENDDSVAVIIIAGAGRAFSAGADISNRDGESKPSPREVMAGAERTNGLYQKLVASRKPLIAEVHGYALGGGCNLAVSCDLVVAADNAVFGYPELKVGLAATAVSPPLVHQIGRKAAFELLTLCENISADKALSLGMINRVVPLDELPAAAMGMAEQLAGFDHDALWATKETIRRSAEAPIGKALEMARDMSLRMKIFE